MELTVFHELAIALGLGLLVGFQREWAEKEVAGVRTFPLIAILGVVSARIAEPYGPWIAAVALAGVAVFLTAGNIARMRAGDIDPGITTEIAALVMFVVGVTVAAGEVAVAVVVGGAVAVLLQWKRPLHEFAGNVGEQDLQAVIRLVLVGLVILPALPDQSYGPYGVMNPFRIWLMVVLIVGISLAAYLTYRFIGARSGTLLAGILGGLISSTATTVDVARQSRGKTSSMGVSTAIILIASTIVFGRVLFEIALVAAEILPTTAPPLLVMTIFMAAIAATVLIWNRKAIKDASLGAEPPDLKTAIGFGLVYMIVLLGVAAAQDYFGESGLYAASALSGLTDMDAITLSTAELVKAGQLETAMAWRLILVGAMANLVFKGAVVAVIGGRKLALPVFGCFLLAFAGGAALLLFWP